jgi:hypothetical protein
MTPLQIDGRLDDEVYTQVEPISDVVQMEPHAGDLSTENRPERGTCECRRELSIEPTYSINRVRLYEGDFTTTLASFRLTCTVTPQLFVSALAQFNSVDEHGQYERPPALGIPPRQRAIRGLQRRTQHARGTRAAQSSLRDQDEPVISSMIR